RKSYLDLLVERLYPDQNVSFGFTDAQAKFSYDLTPVHQLHVAFTGGRSRLDRQPDLLGAGNLRNADNRSALGVMTWRYLPSARLSLVQRVAAGVNRFTNTSRDGAELDAGDAQDAVYRADLSFAHSPGVLLESGGEVRRSTGTGRQQRLAGGRFQSREDFNSAALASSAYAQVRLQRPRVDDVGRGDAWSITPGIRVDRWSLVGRTTASPWIQTLWPLTRALTVRAGAGVH